MRRLLLGVAVAGILMAGGAGGSRCGLGSPSPEPPREPEPPRTMTHGVPARRSRRLRGWTRRRLVSQSSGPARLADDRRRRAMSPVRMLVPSRLRVRRDRRRVADRVPHQRHEVHRRSICRQRRRAHGVLWTAPDAPASDADSAHRLGVQVGPPAAMQTFGLTVTELSCLLDAGSFLAEVGGSLTVGGGTEVDAVLPGGLRSAPARATAGRLAGGAARRAPVSAIATGSSLGRPDRRFRRCVTGARAAML